MTTDIYTIIRQVILDAGFDNVYREAPANAVLPYVIFGVLEDPESHFIQSDGEYVEREVTAIVEVRYYGARNDGADAVMDAANVIYDHLHNLSVEDATSYTGFSFRGIKRPFEEREMDAWIGTCRFMLYGTIPSNV